MLRAIVVLLCLYSVGLSAQAQDADRVKALEAEIAALKAQQVTAAEQSARAKRELLDVFTNAPRSVAAEACLEAGATEVFAVVLNGQVGIVCPLRLPKKRR